MNATATDMTADAERRARLTGVALMLAAVALFAVGDALGKYVVATYPVGQLLLLRSGMAFVLLAPVMWRAREAFLHLKRPHLHLLRALLSSADVAAFFAATIYLPLADVITYYLACPIFVTALSALLLRERVGWRRWSAIAVGFCGVLIALRPSSQVVSWPALLALGGSLSFALLMVVTRSLKDTPDIVLASTQFTGSLMFGAVLAPFGWVTPTPATLALIAGGGAVSVAALFCVNRSLKSAPASVVVPYQYSMIVWAVLLGYVIFNDTPAPATLIGAAIIIASGLYIYLRERKLGGDAPLPSPPVP